MEDLDKKIARYVNGEASDSEVEELLNECRNSPETLEKLSQQVKTNRLLSSLSIDFDLNNKEIMTRIEGDLPDISNKVIRKIESRKSKNKQIIAFAIAAAALLALSLIISLDKTYATVADSLEAHWEHEVNDHLKKGRYHVKEGFTKLKFKSGATVIIEGPADFRIINDMNLFLESGKVVADVPPSAHGFRIDTPTSNTIDLGTRFAVAADKKGKTEIHVIEGLVKSKSLKNTDFTELRKDEALQVTDAMNSNKLEADSGKFLTMLPPDKMADLKYILWRFDEGKGSIANESTMGYKKNFQAYLKSENANTPLPEWVDGKFGKALKFDGSTNYVETDFPGIGGSAPRTVCFWVKADNNSSNGYAIITWGSFKNFGATWQISLNPTKEDGPLGRIRCGTHRGQVIGTTDLRDNKWHHVAVVMYGGPDADVSTNILIYIDGKLENAYRKSVRRIDTDIESQKAIKVQMGKNAAANHNPKVTYKYFRGALDEVYVFNWALKPNEIRQIIKNQLDINFSK